MIINENVSSPVISNVLSSPSRFKIKASAKAFKILSGFYSEPILAIPRELGANAWDSHVKAGNTNKMFEVHAPNALEPWFSIRDFGTGLSPEAIDTIYTTYFESTKTEDNDSDGCMGLGSKTPFNYTENFTVTSWYAGKKHVYNCFVDEAGAPNIMHIASENSDDASGLEVKFAVKIGDINMWHEKITRAYEPFRFRPSIKGAKIEFKPRDYIYSGKNWAMRNNNGDHYSSRGCNAFMGNYCYPINTQAVRSAILNSTSSTKHNVNVEQALSYGNFDLFFNIGDLEVAPNKEQLQYSDNNQTANAIAAAIAAAVTELKDLVYKSIEKPKSRWEAMSLYTKYNGYSSSYSHIRSIIGDIVINYNGQKVLTNSENILTVHNSCGATSPDKTLNLTSTFEVYTLEGIGARMRKTSAYYPRLNKTLFFYTNNASVKNARLRYYLKTNYNNNNFPFCYIISDISPKTENFFKHMKYFGWDNADVINIDALPRPPSGPRTKKTTNSNDVYTADISDTKSQSVWWMHKPCTVTAGNTYYYVDFLYTNPVWNGKKIEEHMFDVVNYFTSRKLNNGVTTIYGINSKNKHLMEVGNWVNVVDLVKQHITKNISEAEDLLYKHSLIHSFMEQSSLYNIILRNKSLLNMIKSDSTKNMLQDFVNTYAKVYATNSNREVKMLVFMGFKAKQHISLGFDINKFSDILEKKYMGLLGMMRDAYNFDTKKMSTLVNFIDENTKS